MIEYSDSEDSNYHIQLETFNIIIIMCFSRIILQYPIYRHCKVAFLLFVIGFSCYYYHSNFIEYGINVQYYILLFIASFTTSLQLVL